MDYTLYAQNAFERIQCDAPANNCSVLIHENGRLVDAGLDCPGGWMAAKTVLEGLLGGRGQVSYSHQPLNGLQIPALELFLDDPLSAAAAFSPDENGIIGVRGGQGYVLGLCLAGAETAKKAKGNLVAAAPGSLLASLVETASLAARAIWVLQAEGITDIQWGWSSCPLAPLQKDTAAFKASQAELAARHGSVNLWLRGEEAALRRATAAFTAAPLFLHQLATACTFLNAPAAAL